MTTTAIPKARLTAMIQRIWLIALAAQSPYPTSHRGPVSTRGDSPPQQTADFKLSHYPRIDRSPRPGVHGSRGVGRPSLPTTDSYRLRPEPSDYAVTGLSPSRVWRV